MTTQQDDRAIMFGMVEAMTRANDVDELMRHWARDVLHFDSSVRCLDGSDAARAEIAAQFSCITDSGASIRSSRCLVDGNLGVVVSIQDVWAQHADGSKLEMTVRQTDCFEKRDGQWQLVHEHVSLPIGDALTHFGGAAAGLERG